MTRNSRRVTLTAVLVGLGLLVSSPVGTARAVTTSAASVNQLLEWNQIFIDTLIATNTANSSSQRLGAIVHTAIFDAYNGIQERYTHPDSLGVATGDIAAEQAQLAAETRRSTPRVVRPRAGWRFTRW
jgi:hypothetical protein